MSQAAKRPPAPPDPPSDGPSLAFVIGLPAAVVFVGLCLVLTCTMVEGREESRTLRARIAELEAAPSNAARELAVLKDDVAAMKEKHEGEITVLRAVQITDQALIAKLRRVPTLATAHADLLRGIEDKIKKKPTAEVVRSGCTLYRVGESGMVHVKGAEEHPTAVTLTTVVEKKNANTALDSAKLFLIVGPLLIQDWNANDAAEWYGEAVTRALDGWSVTENFRDVTLTCTTSKPRGIIYFNFQPKRAGHGTP